MRVDALRDGDRARSRRRRHADRRRRHGRHDVDDQRRSGSRTSRTICRARGRLAARRRRVCGRHRDHAGVPRALRRLGSRPTRSSSTRTSGCSRRSISARSTAAAWMSCGRRSRSCPSTCGPPKASRGVRNLMDTGIQLGRRFRSLKLWMVLRHFGARGHPRRRSPSTSVSRGSSPVGGRGPRLRAPRTCAVQRRLLSRAAARAARRVDRRARRVQRTTARRRQRDRRGLPLAHAAERDARAAPGGRSSARRRSATSRARGSCSANIPPSSRQSASVTRLSFAYLLSFAAAPGMSLATARCADG